MSQSFRQRLWAILEVARPGDHVSRGFDIVLLSLIVLNILAVILDSVPSINRRVGPALNAFEWFSVAVFSAEYLLRLWSAPADPRFAQPIRGRLRFMVTPLALIDLIAVLPAYLPLFGLDLRFVRALRLLRIFRAAKLARYISALRLFGDVIREKREELILTTCVFGLMLLITSCLMYFAENEAQPEAFSSIPAAMWWSVVTLTTVGYGDIHPVTSLGRLLASFSAILGIGFFALPTAILGSGFIEEVEKRKKHHIRTCPYCGREISR
ncbi:ion transporter [Tautonia rosea]|uniref:ion transporter n=1 Tax=Tautonia rosea TaxID=2728037 RepID=UPI0014747C4B|nr:ion transporter [Tautonia rosea]